MHSLVEDVVVLVEAVGVLVEAVGVQPRRKSSAVVGLAVALEVVVVVHVALVEDEAMVKCVEMQEEEVVR